MNRFRYQFSAEPHKRWLGEVGVRYEPVEPKEFMDEIGGFLTHQASHTEIFRKNVCLYKIAIDALLHIRIMPPPDKGAVVKTSVTRDRVFKKYSGSK